ncbi:MAG: 50S ribosomal protein L15 [Myxococcota bacterium]
MLDQLKRRAHSKHPRKRVGRGIGSGHGKTCGRGQKGAGARSGTRKRGWYEGGQLPLIRRIPKRGFVNLFRTPFQVVNLRDLARLDGPEVTPETLTAAGLVKRADWPIKLLAVGEAPPLLHVRVQALSGSARQKIEAAGGSVECVPARRRGSPEADGA